MTLLMTAFKAGFVLVLDAMEERAFPPENNTGGNAPISWNGGFSEIPPVLIARLVLQAPQE